MEKNYTIEHIVNNNIDKTAYGFIYITTNLVNNKKYIGKKKFNNRWETYLGSGVLLHKAILKYGKENFKREIIKYSDTTDELNKAEILFITKYEAVNDNSYYNIASGGEGGFGQFAGKSEEELLLWRQRMSESRKGRVFTDEWKARLVEAGKRRLANPEDNPMYGKKGKENAVSKCTVMICINSGELLETFDCIGDANDFLKKKRTSSLISRVCINKEGTAYGYLWLFIEDYVELKHDDKLKDWVSEMKRRNKKHSPEAKNIYKNFPVYMLASKTLDIIKKYNNIYEATSDTLVNSTNILKCSNHQRHTAGGHSWIFVSEYNETNKNDVSSLYKSTSIKQ